MLTLGFKGLTTWTFGLMFRHVHSFVCCEGLGKETSVYNLQS